MEKSNRAILYALIIVQVLVCVVASVFTYTSVERSEEHTKEVLHHQALNDAEDKLRERVDSICTYIDHEREVVVNEAQMLGEAISHSMAGVNEAELHPRLTGWAAKLVTSQYGKAIKMLLHETEEQAITLFADGQSTDVTDRFTAITPAGYVRGCPYYNVISYNGAELYIFASRDDLDAAAKASVYDYIHAATYGADGYVWVNEIVNYNGGTQYALRRIHPNLKETEGDYLSTEETDVVGGHPYLVELNGIKRDGEIFHTYYFKNKSDENIAEKASYARFYQPFDWIVATGEPLDEILRYSKDLQDYSREVFNDTLFKSLVILAVVFGVDILLISVSIRRYKASVETYMQKAVREREQIFNIVAQHSNRILYAYVLATGTTRPWDTESGKKDILSHLYTGSYSHNQLEKNEPVMPDSVLIV